MGLTSLGLLAFRILTGLPFIVTLCCFLIPILIIFPPLPVERSDALRQTHSKVGLPPSKSKLKDQLSAKHKSKDGQAPKIHSLHIYPIKSCKGIEVSKSKVLPTGMEFDRLYTFAQLRSPSPLGINTENQDVDEHKWEFITQRQFPLLTTVNVDLWVPDPTKKSRLLESVNEAFLVVRFPWQEPGLWGTIAWLAAKIGKGMSGLPEKEILLPVNFPSEEEITANSYEYSDVRIWRETVRALNLGKELPEELRRYLGVTSQLGLFRINPDERREVFRCAPRKDEAGYQPIIDFHDAVCYYRFVDTGYPTNSEYSIPFTC